MNNPGAQAWEDRYSADHYMYGTEPNDFLVEAVKDLPLGRVLCLADGEGRNGVYLARLGHDVTSMDLTHAGIGKAKNLAEERGVKLNALVADLATYDLGNQEWDVIVSVFAHTPPEIRKRVHGAISTALSPGGRLLPEAYTPDQIGRGTCGPPKSEFCMTLEGLTRELTDLEFTQGKELVRPVIEGPGHTGEGAVVQVVATPITCTAAS